MADIYTENGYGSRADYLEALAADNGVPVEAVMAIADMMGEDEDFDGLVTFVEDHVVQLLAAYGETA